MTTYEVWEAEDEGTEVSFFPQDNSTARKLLPEGAKLLRTIEAETWEEAVTLHHELMGWEPYKP
jgi:hypothetical protein